MLFQQTFQHAEAPSRVHLSCCHYHSKARSGYQLHCHSYYEISYIVSGERYETYGGTRYKVSAGSFFFIPPLVMHSNENITDVEDIVIQFSAGFVSTFSDKLQSEMLTAACESGKPYIQLGNNTEITEIMRNIAENYDKRIDVLLNERSADYGDTQAAVMLDLERNGLAFSLLSRLLKEKLLLIGNGNISVSRFEQLDVVISHIMSHLDEKPDMEASARMVGMSYFNFSRFFKDATGFNYTEFCNLLRLSSAEEQLIKTDKKISDIAESIGIDTQSYFTRLFKRFNGCSPAEYRKRYKSA